MKIHPLSVLVQRHNAKRIAEIGILNGHLTRTVLRECEGVEYYLMVDPWVPYNDLSSTSRDMTAEKMEGLYRKNVEKMKDFPAAKIIREGSVVASRTVPDNSLDIVYIDAAHDTDSVVTDIHVWTSKIKDHGILSGHDCSGGWQTVINGVLIAYPEFDFATRLDQGVWFIELTPEKKEYIRDNTEVVFPRSQ